MDSVRKIYSFFDKLERDEFIKDRGFQKIRVGEEEMFALAASLRSKRGCEVTVSFNIHDDEPNECEMAIRLHNRCSIEQLKKAAGDIAIEKHREIGIYEDNPELVLASWYNLDESNEALDMMKSLLSVINKKVMIMV